MVMLYRPSLLPAYFTAAPTQLELAAVDLKNTIFAGGRIFQCGHKHKGFHQFLFTWFRLWHTQIIIG